MALDLASQQEPWGFGAKLLSISIVATNRRKSSRTTTWHLRSVRRWLIGMAIVFLAGVSAYWVLLRDGPATAEIRVSELASRIGNGEDAVGVTTGGKIVPGRAVPSDSLLPELSIGSVPEGGKLQGSVLAEAKVLGAAPRKLRPYVERSRYGELGVDVVLTAGIELRFGDASRAKRKWAAAAALLADPSISALSYINLYVPYRPSVWGSDYSLPPAQ